MRESYQDTKNSYLCLHEEKRQLELKMSENLRGLQAALNMKQREMEELQVRLLGSVDIELERMKIKNKLDLQYSQELETKQTKIDHLSEELMEIRRVHEQINTKYNTVARDNEKSLDFIKEAHKTQVSELINEITELQEQIGSDVYKDKYNEVKRESENFKGRLSLIEKELNECNLELERVRREKNDHLINNARQLENERAEKRELKSIYDKLAVRSRYLEEESKVHTQKTDSLERKIFELMDERQRLLEESGLKDKRIFDLQNQVKEVEDTLREKDVKMREELIRDINDERNRNRELGDKISGYEKENQNLRKKIKSQDEEDRERLRNTALVQNTHEKRAEDLHIELKKHKEHIVMFTHEKDEWKLNDTNIKEKLKRAEDNLESHKNDGLIIQRELDARNQELRDLKEKVRVMDVGRQDGANTKNIQIRYEKVKRKLKQANKKVIELLAEKVLNIGQDNHTAGQHTHEMQYHNHMSYQNNILPNTQIHPYSKITELKPNHQIEGENMYVKKVVPCEMTPQVGIHGSAEKLGRPVVESSNQLRMNHQPIPGVRQPIEVHTRQVSGSGVPQNVFLNTGNFCCC